MVIFIYLFTIYTEQYLPLFFKDEIIRQPVNQQNLEIFIKNMDLKNELDNMLNQSLDVINTQNNNLNTLNNKYISNTYTIIELQNQIIEINKLINDKLNDFTNNKYYLDTSLRPLLILYNAHIQTQLYLSNKITSDIYKILILNKLLEITK
jgi:hypothetical protein